MKIKSLLLFGILVLSLSLLLTACGGGSENASSSNNQNDDNNTTENNEEAKEEQVTLKFGHTFTEDNHKNLFGIKLGEILEEKSNGSMTVEMYPSSQLGDDLEMLQAAQAGTLEIVMGPMPLLTNFMPEAGIFDLPYLFDSQDQAEAVLAGEVGDYFLEEVKEYDLVGLGYIYPMERNIFSKKPIKNVDDIQGFKIREQEAPGYIKTWEVLGAQPSAMGYSEVFTALQQGVVDAATGAPDQVIQDGFDELIDYFIRAGVHIPIEPVLISKKVWDDLSSEQQEVLGESMDEALEYQKETYLKHTQESIDKMKEQGIEILEPEDIDVASISEKAKNVYDELIADVPKGQELYEMIEEGKASVQ